MPQVVFTKEFNKCLRDLLKGGKKGKDAVQRARAAQAEAAAEGGISTLQRTHHGESRLPNAEKFDLGDGYRLVVQLVDGKENTRAFLFAGDHDDAERWLENHRDYVWVKKASDGTLEFVQVSKPSEPKPATADLDLESPESLLELPLLRDLTEDEWATLALAAETNTYARTVTAADWERDANGIMEHLANLSTDGTTSLLVDLFDHAHKREWNALHRRIDVVRGTASAAKGIEAAAAMLDPVNSETFITWDDSKDLPPDQDWADWMLFLHSEQKELATRDLSGPARLRGVSGSGKTCVMIHRARYLAKKHGQPLLVVTLTESMRKLLDSLIGMLCGVERSLITTFTMTGFAKEVIRQLHSSSERWYTLANQERLNDMAREARDLVRKHRDFGKTPLRQLDDTALQRFLVEEIAYVRSRLRRTEYDTYPTKAFKRRGRAQALAEVGRRVCLDAIRYWDDQLASSRTLDYEGIVQAGLELLLGQEHAQRQCRWRSVLVDEVQDLSQLEVSLLGNVMTPSGGRIASIPDGLFMVGDGAQSIYKKGFSLGGIGINVSSRSYVYKKNYRNTREILTAAYGLIKAYEFADVDEDNLQYPLEPDFATRHGERPFLVKCRSMQQEAELVGQRVKMLLDDKNRQSTAQICVVGTNSAVREAVGQELQRLDIPWAELREDAGLESDRVKVSTIESAKGHEFITVFIVGLIDGVLPRELPEEDLPREAARLYVAMTRARDALYLTYSSNYYVKPSAFLASIQQDCTEMQYLDGALLPIA